MSVWDSVRPGSRRLRRSPRRWSRAAALTLTGTGFRGISGGSGGNVQDSPSDHPVVQLRSLESGQTLLLSSANWSAVSYTSTAVSGLPPGWTMATMFVNGINSTSVLTSLIIGPEMAVLGNGVEIADGDTTPSLADYTDFGSAAPGGGTVVRTFTITNSGPDPLTLSGNPKVAVSGSQAADFTVTLQPATPVAASGSTTFQVTFAPTATGLRSAILYITNDVAAKNPYDFAIQGTGVDTTPPSITSRATSRLPTTSASVARSSPT